MKQLFIYVAILFCSLITYSQTLDEVRKLIEKTDLPGAKKTIDSYLSNALNAVKADGWYYKGVIYNECSKKDAMVTLCNNCRQEAFDAFKKYQELDPKNVYMELEQNVRLFDIYNGFFDLASKNYAVKSFTSAYENFNNALMVENYIYKKGFKYNDFKFSDVDTSLIMNMALSARLSKNDDNAVKNYLQLAEINLDGPYYLEMYQYLVQYYIDKKNATALNGILAKAKKLYPFDDYWAEAEINQVDRNDKINLFAKYEEIIKNNPGSFIMVYNYCVELFNYIYVSDNLPTDAAGRKAKLEEVLKKALAIKNSADVNLLMARHIFNKIFDMQDEIAKIKEENPDDIKKKAALKAQILSLADDCIKYAGTTEKIYAAAATLKPLEKANYKNALGILKDMYKFKGNTTLAEGYNKKAALL